MYKTLLKKKKLLKT